MADKRFALLGHQHSDTRITKYKRATLSRDTDATPSADDELFGWNLKHSWVYSVEGHVEFQSTSGTPNVSWDFLFSSAPSGAQYQYSVIDIDAAYIQQDVLSMTTQVDVTSVDADKRTAVHMIGRFSTHATVGGTLDFAWSQDTSDGTAMTCRAGSWIRITPLGPS